MNLLILVVDDEPDMEALFRPAVSPRPRTGRFNMQFALSAPQALELIELKRQVQP